MEGEGVVLGALAQCLSSPNFGEGLNSKLNFPECQGWIRYLSKRGERPIKKHFRVPVGGRQFCNFVKVKFGPI